jgi:membrane protease YdiL (CAAX protease family)
LREVVVGGVIGFLPFAALNVASDPGREALAPALGTVPLLFVGAVTLWLYVWEAGFAWIFSLQRYSLGAAAWGLVRPPIGALWKVPAGLAVMLSFSLVYTGIVNAPGEDLGLPHSAAAIAVVVLTTCVMAPVFEELVFRGFIFQGLIRPCGALSAGLLSATCFSLAHWDPQNFLPLLVCGLTLAWVYYSTRSLYAAIVLHALFNLMPTLAFVLAW